MAYDPRQVLNPEYVKRTPECFDSAAQYREWVELKRQSTQWQSHPGVCVDCTPEFKEKMMRQGRCQHPETKFVTFIDKYGDAESLGVNQFSPFYKRVMKGQLVFTSWKDEDDKQ